MDKNYVSKNKIPELVNPNAGNLNLSEDEFVDAPMLSWAHRMTSQKGLKYFQEATERLFDNWEKLFPGKPMPIILAGGPPEDAGQLQYLDKLRNPALGSNKARIPYVDVIKTGSNLNSSVFTEIMETIGLDYSEYEPGFVMIDDVLLKMRNEIAHGERIEGIDLDEDRFREIYDVITGLMEKYITQITNAVYLKKYKR